MAQTHNISYIEQPMTVGTTVQGPQKRYRRLRFPSFPANVWADKNPLLQKGEIGHESDTGRMKVGDGFTYWLDLPYNSVGEKGERGDDATINGLKTATLAGGLNIDIKQEGDTITISAQGDASGGYSREEIDNKISVVNAGIDANALAIQKTRDDYMSADTDIMAIVNNHAEELTTLRGNQASLGDQVAGIESKIPESASGTNHLITKQQLLDEEMDIRDDLNETASELQTQITAQAAEIATKQDQLTAGDNIIISGNVISATGAGGGAGLSFVVYDTLPETGESGIIYLVPKDSEAPDVYNEYVWINATQTFELIGSTQVDLTDYATKGELAGYLPVSGGTMTGSIISERQANPDRVTYSQLIFGGRFDNGDGTFGKNFGLYAMSLNDGLYLSKLQEGAGTDQLTYGFAFNISGRSSNISPTFYGAYYTLGTSSHRWDTIYVTTIAFRDKYINVPDKAGTMALLEDLENIDALPDQTGNEGKVLTTDGTTASWQEPAGGTKVIFREWEE